MKIITKVTKGSFNEPNAFEPIEGHKVLPIVGEDQTKRFSAVVSTIEEKTGTIRLLHKNSTWTYAVASEGELRFEIMDEDSGEVKFYVLKKGDAFEIKPNVKYAFGGNATFYTFCDPPFDADDDYPLDEKWNIIEKEQSH